MGMLQEVMAKEWGAQLIPEFTPKIISATADEQKVVNDHPDRLTLMFINLGDRIAYAHVSREVSSTLGLYLDKSGGFISMNWKVDGLLVGMEWWIEADAATSIYVVSMIGLR